MNPVEVRRGSSPVILGLPHTGTHVPADIQDRLNANGKLLADTDWHIHTLYDGLLPGASTVRATFHRYVIDANRDPSGQSLYPGQNTTGLIPLTDFDEKPIWEEGRAPDDGDIATRLAAFHRPYHEALAAEIARVKAEHGVAILYDCHSIRSVVPFLFEGTLPDFNIGTNDGNSCAPEIEQATRDVCAGAAGLFPCRQRPLQGGLDHAALRPAQRGRSRHPDGADAGDASRKRGAAVRLFPGQGREAASLSPRHPWRTGADCRRTGGIQDMNTQFPKE